MPEKSAIPAISLLTFNTLGTPFFAPAIRKRYKKIAEIIASSDIDVVCFQEVSSYYNFGLLKRYLSKTFPFIAYKKFILGPKGGLVTFSKYPFTQVSYASYKKQGKFSNLTFYTQILQNGILSVILKDIPITILNTVVITDFEFNWSPSNHLYNLVRFQVEEAAIVTMKVAKKTNVVMTGDFNMAKESALYNTFLEMTKGIDVFQKDTIPTYYNDRTNYRFVGKKSERIDYIFLVNTYDKITIQSKDYLFKDKVTIDKKHPQYLSDHIALWCKFGLKS